MAPGFGCWILLMMSLTAEMEHEEIHSIHYLRDTEDLTIFYKVDPYIILALDTLKHDILILNH